MDAAIPLDTSERLAWEHAGVRWSLAYLPLGKDDELRAAFVAAYEPMREAAPTPAQRAALKVAYGEIVRWGVAGWSLAKLPAAKEREQYAGVAYDVLARPTVALLAKVDGGALIQALALRVLEVNALSEEDLLGFR